MAFPTTITTDGNVGRGCGGPFLSSGGNVYVITLDDALTDLRALKATDPSSSFSGVGTDVVVEGGAGNVSRLAACQVGDAIHVVTFGDARNLKYHVFSMSSDSWTTSNESIKTTFSTLEAQPGLGIAVRSDGDVIVIYNGPSGASMGSDYDRACYARRESGTWTVDIALDTGGATHWIAAGLVFGSSDRAHLFFKSGILSSVGSFYQRTLTSANALQTFPSAFDTSAVVVQQRGCAYDSGGTTKVRFPYSDGTGQDGASAKLDSADAPTVSVDADITGTRATVGARDDYSLAADGTTLWHAFADSASDIYLQSNANDAGWSTPALFYTGAVLQVFTNIYTRGSSVVIGIVFGETDPKYTEYTISGGGPVTHATTGALTAGTGALSGSAQHKALHGTTGTLSAGTGALAGAASSATARPSSGVLVAGAGTIAGAAARSTIVTHSTSGTLVGVSALAGAASSATSRPSTGVLSGSGAALVGTAAHVIAFVNVRQAIIDGLVSAQSEANGWNAERANIPVTAVVRTSDTVVTITLPALASYSITANETVTATIPSQALSGGQQVVADPTFSISEGGGGVTHTTSGALEAGIGTLAGTVTRIPAISTFSENFDSALNTTTKWNAVSDGGTVNATANGVMEQQSLGSSVSTAYIKTQSGYNLTGQEVVVKFVQPMQGVSALGYGYESYLSVEASTGNSIDLVWTSNDTLIGKYWSGASQTGVFEITYSASDHAWWRIREAGGTAYFDTAPSTASNPPQAGDWTNRGSVTLATLGFDVSSVNVILQTDNWQIMGTTPIGPAKWDGLNTVAGAVTHAATGAMQGSGATLAGTASSATERTSSGALAAGTGTLAGTASSATDRLSTGALTGTGAALDGTSVHLRPHDTSGVLAAGAATLVGTAARTQVHETTSVLSAGTGVLDGTAARSAGATTHLTTGALVGVSVLSGSANRTRVHATDGALSAGTGTLSGAADSATERTSNGALVGPGAVLAGTADSATIRTSSGALVGPGAVLDGVASSATERASSGVLVAAGAVLDGTASSATDRTSTGALVGSGAVIVGISDSATIRPSSGALVAGTGALVGIATSATIRPSSGALAAQNPALAGTAIRFRAHATTGALEAAGATLAGSADSATARPSSGALTAGTGELAGTSVHLRPHTTSGTLTASGALLAGSASRGAPTFDSLRQAIINGLVSDRNDADGWNNQKVNIPVTAVVRTNDTTVTITLPALASFDISQFETITATVPAGAVAGGEALVASPTFTILTDPHVTTGALAAGTGALSGAASSATERTSTGALSAGVGELSGAAFHSNLHATTGALGAGTGTLSGVADSATTRPSTGDLTAGTGALSGSAARQAGFTSHDTSGTLAAGAGTLEGTASWTRVHTTDGALAAGSGTLAGTANRTRDHAVTGALQAQTAALSGTANRTRIHTTSGAIGGTGAALAGSADSTTARTSSGTLAGPGAVLDGAASRTQVHATTGVLEAQAAVLAGTAARTRVHATTGTLAGAGAALTGSASLLEQIVGSMAATETGADSFSARRPMRSQMFVFFH